MSHRIEHLEHDRRSSDRGRKVQARVPGLRRGTRPPDLLLERALIHEGHLVLIYLDLFARYYLEAGEDIIHARIEKVVICLAETDAALPI